MKSRLGHHLLRRLRHRLEAEAFDRAVEADILIAGTWDVAGVQMRGYTAHPAMLERTPRQIQQLLAKLGSRDGSSRSPAMSSIEYDGIEYSVDEDSRPPMSRGPGRKPGASKATGARPDDDVRYRRLTVKLLREVRCSADRPQAADVATLLLVARAVSESGVSLAEVLRVLRTQRPIVAVVASVAGFERSFADLLARGLVLPGKMATANGHELSSTSVRFTRHGNDRWRVIMFPGSKFDADDPEDNDKRVGRAALSSYPILGVAEHMDRLPQRLRDASLLALCTGPLDSALVEEVVEAVLGEAPGNSLPDDSCALLTLSDLSLAVRPGVAAQHAFHVLRQIAATRCAEVEAGNGKPADKDSHRETSSRARSWKSGRGDPGSGSEIIQPVPVTGADSDRLVPRVESLTGYGEAAEWAMSLKADVDLWRTGDLSWEDMSTRILLSGPPGTGKTLFARALCNSLGVPLVATSVATWLEPGYLGDVLKRMTVAFAEAESLKPAILFVDEFDGIGTRRQRGDWAEYGNSIINRGLELLDGAARSSGVIVVAATNHPTMIDPALLRSGRLERHIEILPPDTAALVGILRHHLKGDLDAVVASAPLEIMVDALLPAAAAGNGEREPVFAGPEETAGNDAAAMPPVSSTEPPI